MKPDSEAKFKQNYQILLNHLTLKGLRSKTIEAYTFAIRRIGHYFNYQIDDHSEEQLLDYFLKLVDERSWETVKRDLYGLRFYYKHVLKKPWIHVDLIKPPKYQRIPDVLTVNEVSQLLRSTKRHTYRVFLFTLYSLGLRLSEGLRLEIGDIDAERGLVHIRDSKGNKDRLVPLPDATLGLKKD